MASITLLLTELKIEYKIIGEEATAACPFHSPDRHPSWSVNTRNGLHHCFSCGASGNLAHLVSHIKEISYPEAVIWVNSRVGWARADKWREDYENKNFAPQEFKISEVDLALFTDPPNDALKSRAITLESSSKFGVKWNPQNHSWIFPIRDPYTKALWGWQEKNERIFRNYPGGIKKSRTLFGLDAFDDGSTAVLIESPVDAVRFDVAGIRGGLSSFGVQVSDFQLSLIHERSEHLVLALDNDRDGIRETTRIAKEFRSINVSVFSYGNLTVKDPGEMTDLELAYGFANAIPALKWIREH